MSELVPQEPELPVTNEDERSFSEINASLCETTIRAFERQVAERKIDPSAALQISLASAKVAQEIDRIQRTEKAKTAELLGFAEAAELAASLANEMVEAARHIATKHNLDPDEFAGDLQDELDRARETVMLEHAKEISERRKSGIHADDDTLGRDNYERNRKAKNP